MQTQQILRHLQQRVPVFLADAAMDGLFSGLCLHLAQREALYQFLPHLVMRTSPTHLGLTITIATLLKHTIYSIAADYTKGYGDWRRNDDGLWIRQTLGPKQGSFEMTAKEPKNQLFSRCMIIGELAFIALMLGGGISFGSCLSVYFTKVLADRFSNFTYFNWLQAKVNLDAFSWTQPPTTDRWASRGRSLGNR